MLLVPTVSFKVIEAVLLVKQLSIQSMYRIFGQLISLAPVTAKGLSSVTIEVSHDILIHDPVDNIILEENVVEVSK